MKNLFILSLVYLLMIASCKKKESKKDVNFDNVGNFTDEEGLNNYINIIRNSDSAKVLKNGITYFNNNDQIEKNITEFNETIGVGYVKKLNLSSVDSLDNKLVNYGKFIFSHGNCYKCHSLDLPMYDKSLPGPGLKDLMQRRNPEWVINYLTLTKSMLKGNIIASSLEEQRGFKMKNYGFTIEESRALLEYFRSLEK